MELLHMALWVSLKWKSFSDADASSVAIDTEQWKMLWNSVWVTRKSMGSLCQKELA